MAHRTSIVEFGTLKADMVAGQTLYFGRYYNEPTTAEGRNKHYFRKNIMIVFAEIDSYAEVAGSNENWSVYIRKNGTTDYLIATVGENGNERYFCKETIDIPMEDGDYFEIKLVNPNWATAPEGVVFAGSIYIE